MAHRGGHQSISGQPVSVVELQIEQIQRVRERNPKLAFRLSQQLLISLPETLPLLLKILTHLTYAQVLTSVGRPAEAVNICKRFEAQVETLGGEADRARLLLYAAYGVAYTYMGELVNAMSYHQKLLGIAQRQHNLREECRACINIGWVHACLDNYPAALAFFSRALSLARGLEIDIAQAITLDNMGIVYGAIGNEELALQSYQQAYEIRKRGGYTSGTAQSLLNIATVYHRKGDYKQALSLAREARTIAHSCSEIRVEAYCWQGIGRALRELGNLKRALYAFQQCLRLRRQSGYLPEMYAIMVDIGELYIRLGQFRRAEKLLLTTYNAIFEHDVKNLQFSITQLLYTIAKHRGENEKALYWHELMHQAYQKLIERTQFEQASRMMMMETISKMTREHENYLRRIAELEHQVANQRRELSQLVLERLTYERSLAHSAHVPKKEQVLKMLFSDNERTNSQHYQKALTEYVLGRIDLVLPGFITALSQKIPTLTPAELLICALLRLQCRTKEIAEVLHLSEKTVNNHRLSIRAKCGIPRKVALSTYLCSIV